MLKIYIHFTTRTKTEVTGSFQKAGSTAPTCETMPQNLISPSLSTSSQMIGRLAVRVLQTTAANERFFYLFFGQCT